MNTQKIDVRGNCQMCKDRIEKTANGLDGVLLATWDQKSEELSLSFDSSKTSVDAISKTIAEVGHDTDKYKADLDVYSALPECCKYRD